MLRRLPTVCLCAFIATLSGACAADLPAPSLPRLNERAIDTYIIPRFEALEAAAGKLAAELSTVCERRSGQLTAVREDFKQTALAWAAVAFLRFGPMAVDGRPERFAFWPDPRRVVQRQLRSLIARRDVEALDPHALAKKSAAVQGLPALEVLLTDTKHPIGADGDESGYRCRFAVAVAKNLTSIARDVISGWTGAEGWRRAMLEPGAGNAHYKTAAEASAELVRALLTGLQMIQDRQVMPLIAAEGKPGKSARLPFAGAGLSVDFLTASIAACKAYYEAMDLASFIPKDKDWMKPWIISAFDRLARDGPLAIKGSGGAKGDPERARMLRFLRFHVDGLRTLIGRQIAPLAGLTIGFNELDGD